MRVATRFLLLSAVTLGLPTIATAQPTPLSDDSILKPGAVGYISPDHDDSYAPTRFGIPDTIGGYSVFAVLTENNFVCMKPGEMRLVIQSPQPTIEDGPRDFPDRIIKQLLHVAGFTDSTQWEWSIVGPGVTRGQVIGEFHRSHNLFKTHGCPTHNIPNSVLASPAPICSPVPGSTASGGEVLCPGSGQGYAIIQNLDASVGDSKTNAQSVILVAPSVGNDQELFKECSTCLPRGGFSALANNVMTDGLYFLQVGLHFTNRPPLIGNPPLPDPPDCPTVPVADPGNPFSPNGIGTVVFAGAQTDKHGNTVAGDLHPRALCVPYIAGHHYYTTISHSMGGPWWTCAGDIQNPTTYRCRHHPHASGTYIVRSLQGTNVFAENWNKIAGWHVGFPYQWVAYEARTYVNGIGHPWSNEAHWTQHYCNTKWPVAHAIVENRGLTKLDGYAFFNTSYLPVYCE